MMQIKNCECGKPLMAMFNKFGKRIGVTHKTIEDEDFHFIFFNCDSIIKRIKQN